MIKSRLVLASIVAAGMLSLGLIQNETRGVRAEDTLTSKITLEATSGENDVFKFNFTQGDNPSSAPAWNNSANEVRAYGNNELSIELLSGGSSHITSVSFTGSTNQNITWNDWTCYQDDVTSSTDHKTWTVGAASNYQKLSFHVNSSSKGHLKITSISITYALSDSSTTSSESQESNSSSSSSSASDSSSVTFDVVDTLTAENLNLSGSYDTFDTSLVTTPELTVSYSGQAMKSSADAIQLRATNPSGIISTSSGWHVKKISVKWNSATGDRTLSIYGSDEPFGDSSELYNYGDTIASIHSSESEVVINGDYSYVGLRSSKSALYLDEISIYWEQDVILVPVDSVSIDQGDALDIRYNEKQKLTATVLPADADVNTVNWSSDNPGVVSTESDGTITAVGLGSATITATSTQDKTKSDSIKVSVTLPAVTGDSAVINMDEFSTENSSDPKYLVDETNYCIEYVNTYYNDRYSEIYIDSDGMIYSSEFNSNLPAISSIALEPYNYKSYLDHSASVLIGDETPEPVGDGIYYVYTATDLNNDGSFLIMPTSDYDTVWLKSIVINFVTSETKAEAFAAEFNELMDTACDVSGQVPPDAETWSFLKEEFMALDASTQTLLRDGSAVQGGDEIEDALWLYDYVVGKYNPSFDPDSSYDDWMGRKPGPQSAYAGVGSTDSLNPTIVAAVGLGALALLSGIGFAFYKKRREA